MIDKETIWYKHFANLLPQHDIKAAAYPAMDEYWNIAIDRCIAKVKQLDTYEPSEDYIFSKIVYELEQLKKTIQ